MIVELYDGEIADNSLIDTVEMEAPPQIGALVTFNVFGDRMRPLEITSVVHVIEIQQPGVMLISRQVAVRCATKPYIANSKRGE